ncbi:MAG: tol-pal system protein YbgF [Deltaproteobacteria bacterium]|nr:tol-pal system protein YbgF [Deltaproteobacteria bacterium]
MKQLWWLGCLLLVTSAAMADTTSQRLDELEKKIQQIEQTYLTNNQDVASAVARAEALSRESTEFQGAIQTNQHLIETQRQETQKLYHDLDLRLEALEERLSLLSVQMSDALRKVNPTVAAEGDAYQAGLSKIQSANYLEAIAQFNAFLKKYPKSSLAPLAQYWIAESYGSLRDWQRAIKEYQKVIDKYPKHEKTRQALLGQGTCFVELGMLDEAEVFFQKVHELFPKTAEANQALEEIKKLADRRAQATQGEKIENMTSYPEATLLEERQKEEQAPPPNSQPDVNTLPVPAEEEQKKPLDF